VVSREQLAAIAARLDRWRWVPRAVLVELVTRDGLCMWAYDRDELLWQAGDLTDGELAALMCAGCPVQDACLELELRATGPNTVGVWGAMTETDRRALYPLWAARDDNAGTNTGDEPADGDGS
jgi:WhiB family redox-sensing transcriptional regulator